LKLLERINFGVTAAGKRSFPAEIRTRFSTKISLVRQNFRQFDPKKKFSRVYRSIIKIDQVAKIALKIVKARKNFSLFKLQCRSN